MPGSILRAFGLGGNMPSIFTNIAAMGVARNLETQTTAYQNSLARLSSGSRFANLGTDRSGNGSRERT